MKKMRIITQPQNENGERKVVEKADKLQTDSKKESEIGEGTNFKNVRLKVEEK